MAKIETLVDDFAAQQPWWSTWTNPGDVVWLDGRLRVEATSTYSGVSTAPIAGFDLTDSAVFVECEPAPTAASRQSMLRVGPAAPNQLIVMVTGDPDVLSCRILTNNVADTTNTPYDPVAMRYLRLRHTGSTVFWETAPDAAGPWTTRRQAPQPSWPITAVIVNLEAGNWGGLPGGVYAWFDNLNVAAPAPPAAGIETFTAGRKWVSAYAQGHAIKSLWKGGVEFYHHVRPPTPPLTNLLTNGSFEADTAGWTGSLTLSRQALSGSHGEFGSWYGRNTGSVNGAHWLQRSAALPVVSGHRYYLRGLAATATATMGNVFQLLNSTTALAGLAATSLTPVNTWVLHDGIWQANTSSLTLRANYTGGSGNQTRTGWLDNVMVIDLTDAFGAGNEPDLEDIREMVAEGGGYWDGTWTPGPPPPPPPPPPPGLIGGFNDSAFDGWALSSSVFTFSVGPPAGGKAPAEGSGYMVARRTTATAALVTVAISPSVPTAATRVTIVAQLSGTTGLPVFLGGARAGQPAGSAMTLPITANAGAWSEARLTITNPGGSFTASIHVTGPAAGQEVHVDAVRVIEE